MYMLFWVACLFSLVLAEGDWNQWGDEIDVGDTVEFEERRRSKLEVESVQMEGPVPCAHDGYSGRPANAIGCTNIAGGGEWSGRIITCASGYYAHPNRWSETIFLRWAHGAHVPFEGCLEVDECAAYGWAGAASCVDHFKARTVTCPTHHYITGSSDFGTSSVTLPGSAGFRGCSPINFCVYLKSSTEPFASCTQSGTNRIMTCQDGYYVIAPTTSTVTLAPTDKFSGCKMIDYCQLYGFSGTGAEKIGASCTQSAIKQRTITCPAGYALTGTNKNPPTRTVTLLGSASFVGCTQVDFCKLIGYSGRDDYTVSCVPSLNARTITCDKGHYPIGSSENSHSITLTGESPFGGCVEANLCTIYGYNDNTEGTASCAAGVNRRTITCQPGYAAVGASAPDSPTIVLNGAESFRGCRLIDNCALYGYSNKTANTRACVNGLNKRTILCKSGYYAAGLDADSVTLIGNEVFTGCELIDNCVAYGYSGKKANTSGCTSGLNSRTITCAVGFYPLGNPLGRRDVTLVASTPFSGCIPIDECDLYGYSGFSSDTESCVDLHNARQVTCDPGFYAVKPDKRTIVLVGNATFPGCTMIRTCEVYGTSGKPKNVESCAQTTVNSRTITCIYGYGIANQGETFQVTLIGNAPFVGCQLIPMCELYGLSKRPDNVDRCIPGINNRTVVCKPGYSVLQYEVDHVVKNISYPFPSEVNIVGYDAFYGCHAVCGNGFRTKGEACDDGNLFSDDGCSLCKVEDGWVCGEQGEACCFAGNHYHMLVEEMQLICRNGWWVSGNIDKLDANGHADATITFPQQAEPNKRSSDNTEGILMDHDYLKLCGVINLSTKLSITKDAQLLIAGSFTVQEGGQLRLSTDTKTPRLLISNPCDAWVSADDPARVSKFDVLAQGLVHVVQDSPMVLNPERNTTEGLTPLVEVNGCFEYNGDFFFEANSIPGGDNYFPLVQTLHFENCNSAVTPENIDHSLPSCPGVELELFSNTYLLVHTYTATLCVPAIVGITVGATAAIAAALAALLLFLNSPTSTTLEYATL